MTDSCGTDWGPVVGIPLTLFIMLGVLPLIWAYILRKGKP